MAYSAEFRENVLQLSDKYGVRKTAEILGISHSTVSNIRKRNHKTEQDHSQQDITVIIAEIDKKIEELNCAKKVLQNSFGYLQQ